jgi:branched-chain amino acid transport system permease protein
MYSVRPWIFTTESAVIAVAAIVLAAVLTPHPAHVAALTVVFAIAGIGLNIVVGFTGLVSLGHVLFFAVGAYCWARLSPVLPIPVAIVIPILISCLLAAVIVGVTLRVGGYYFAITTLAIGLLTFVFASNATAITGGFVGISGISQIEVPFLTGPGQVLATAGLVLAITYALQSSLRASPLGQAMLSMRFDPAAAQSLGVSVTMIRFVVFVISSIPVTLGGVFLAQLIHYISPEQFTLETSIQLLAIAVIGGRGWRWAPILGAVVVITLPELLRPLADYRLVFYGAALTFVSLFMPRGLSQLATWVTAPLRRKAGVTAAAVAERSPVP